jgi:hypothetical protein
MKQRITYVVKDADAFSPEQLEITREGQTDILSLKGVKAAKEHRITLGLNELPSEVHIFTYQQNTIQLLILIFDSSVLPSNNGTNSIFAGLHPSLTPRHHRLHHASRQVYTSSSPLFLQRHKVN